MVAVVVDDAVTGSYRYTTLKDATIQLPRGVQNGTSLFSVNLPEVAVKEMIAARLSSGRGEAGQGMDGHLLLTQAKIAAALTLMDGRRNVGPEDWEVARVIIGVSTSTRDMCREACRGADLERATERQRTNDEARELADDQAVKDETAAVKERVIGFLEDADGARLNYGHMASRLNHRPIKTADRKSQRDRLLGVLESLTEHGLIVQTWTEDQRGERIPEYSLPRD